MTLEQHLVAAGEDATGQHPCVSCGRDHPAFALVQIEDEWTCGTCIIDAQRAATVEAEANATIDTTSWTSEPGLALKAERNRLLDQWRWTFMPDSPLSVANQAEWLAYSQALQAMTRDHETVTTWTWPVPPALVYAS